MIIVFIGHSSLNHESGLYEKVKKAIIDNINNTDGISFYCGGYGNFDSLCARICHKIKEQHPKHETVLITPYITESHQKRLQALLNTNLYDAVIYPPLENAPLRFAISKRNEWMVTNADLIIAFVKYSYGGAYTALKYAKKLGKPIANLAQQEYGESR